MERTEDIKRYLERKHTGGDNNMKGNLFEDFYAVYQIVSCIARYKLSLGSVEFKTQLKDTFVDDLLIAHPDYNIYHQLKNTQSLSWGKADKPGDIAFDFACQIKDCKERDEKFALKLVYSLKDSKAGEHVPEEIKDHTSTEYFDYSPDINSLVMISAPLKRALIDISPNGYETSTDDLANIACVFLGVWKGCNPKHRISLAEIVHRAECWKHINLDIYPDEDISDECKMILDGIDGFEYHIRGRMLYWRIGRMSGNCPWPVDLEVKIIHMQPSDKWELMEILS